MSDKIRTYVITQEELEAAKQNALNRIGMTWEQLEACVDDCGCCVTLPEEFAHLSEDYVRDIWWAYR